MVISPLRRALCNDRSQTTNAPDSGRWRRRLKAPGAAPLIMFYYSTKLPLIRLHLVGALDGQRMEIERDSGDVRIEGINDREVADEVVA